MSIPSGCPKNIHGSLGKKLNASDPVSGSFREISVIVVLTGCGAMIVEWPSIEMMRIPHLVRNDNHLLGVQT
jgi:hypothetical protein